MQITQEMEFVIYFLISGNPQLLSDYINYL